MRERPTFQPDRRAQHDAGGDRGTEDLGIALEQPQECDDQDQGEADDDRQHDVRPRQAERRRLIVRLQLEERQARRHELDHEDRDDERGDRLQDLGHARRCPAHEDGEPDVLAAPVGDDRAEHRQPQQQDRRQLVGPDQRLAQDVAGVHFGRQDDDFDRNQERGDRLGDRADRAVDRRRPRAPKLHPAGAMHQPSLLAYFSSAVQARSPNSAFQRW